MWLASSAGVSTSDSSMKSISSASSTWASAKWPMRHLAMTGMDTVSLISWIMSGSDMRATPPSRRISAGMRSSAITAQAPASSAILACSAVVTSMMAPPFSISARPTLTAKLFCVGSWLSFIVVTSFKRCGYVQSFGQRCARKVLQHSRNRPGSQELSALK